MTRSARLAVFALGLAVALAGPALAQSPASGAGQQATPGTSATSVARNVKNFDKPRRDYLAISVSADRKADGSGSRKN